MNVLDAIFTRRSIRNYTDEKLTEQHLENLLRAGMSAPSNLNLRDWEFLVLSEKEDLLKVEALLAPYGKMMAQASHCILVCGNLEKPYEPYPDFWIQDCAAASQNILTAATAMELGAVWCGIYPNLELTKQAQALFDLPEYILPLNAIALGHPESPKTARDRLDLTKVHHGKWNPALKEQS